MGTNYKIFYYPSYGTKVYLDGSASVGYSYQTACMFARDNAVSMPRRRIYVENGDTGKEDKSYFLPSVGSRMTTELY